MLGARLSDAGAAGICNARGQVMGNDSPVRGAGDEVDAALAALGSLVNDRLRQEGWTRRTLDPFRAATLTRDLPNDVIAVVEIDRSSYRYPEHWPVEVGVAVGVGFGPALDLMPLLTLALRPILIDDSELGRAERVTVELSGPGAVEQAATRIAQLVRDRSRAIGRDFPDAGAIDTRLRQDIDAARAAAVSGDEDSDGVSEDGGRLGPCC